MTTMNELVKKNKQQQQDDDSYEIDNFNDRYSNINLNQNYKCSIDHSDNKLSTKNNKNFVYTREYCSKYMKRLQQFFELSLSADNDNYERWNKNSTKIVESSKMINSFNFYDKKEKVEKGLKKDAINNSTLSLHIEAYENAIEGTLLSVSAENEGLKGKKLSLIEKWKNATQLFILDSSRSDIQNPFEFPRQQKSESTQPETMQFKASQQLLNPNVSNAPKINQQKAVGINVSWDELTKLDSELQLAADRLEIKKFRQLNITVFGSKDAVNVRLATDGELHETISSSKPTSPTQAKDEKKLELIQDEITDKSQKNVETAEIGTQTESWNEKQGYVLVSSCAFAPYSFKAGKQVKCIQVNCVKVSV